MKAMTQPAPDDLNRRRTANRRVGWALAAIALAIFLLSMYLRA